jgi:NADH-quinone oxidoreductase subunit L
MPLAGAVVLLFLGKRIGEPLAGWLATGAMAGAFGMSLLVLDALARFPEEQRHFIRTLFTWIPAGNFSVKAALLLDPLSVTWILFVTGVGALIHLYAIGYMHGDARYGRFFAYLNLFAFSMLVLVLASNFLLMFLGWEGVGVCSYLLISFWFERPTAAAAGKKAFVTNRVGDFGFMLAMFLIVAHLGTLDITTALGGARTLTTGTATAIALLLFVGAAGKSAQLPLFVWLPDAMEGPTPVSALIHAATMVTAGVYLVARAHPFFVIGHSAGQVVAWVGVITAFVAATVALVNNDIKRVLAYSTISQLGYMFLAVGSGAYVAGVFHVVTHAFFKALLFLGAGSVMHGLHDEQDMRRMGGLRKYMPVTAMTFIVAWLAIAGIFPFAGFWSKDEILARIYVEGRYGLWAVGAVTALLTAFYMTRQVRLVFFGNERWRSAESHGEPHESPSLMTFPLMVLAALSVIGGLLNLPFTNQKFDFLGRWLEPVFADGLRLKENSFNLGFALSTIALVIAAVGIAAAVAVYRRGLRGDDPVPARLGPLARVFDRAWFFDDLYAALFVRGGGAAANFLADDVDQGVVDSTVNGVGIFFRQSGSRLRRLQTGFVRNYALALFGGGVLLVAFLAVRGGL